jgi:hypothetical protein
MSAQEKRIAELVTDEELADVPPDQRESLAVVLADIRQSKTLPTARYILDVRFYGYKDETSLVRGQLEILERNQTGNLEMLVYICPGYRILKNGCHGPIPPNTQSFKSVCPRCLTAWYRKDLRDLVQANLTPQNWAILLQSWVWRLGMLCDVRFTHVVGDIRERVAREKDKYREGEAVDQLLADTFKSGKAYRMVRIAKDVAEGKSLEKTLRSFIKS